MTNWDRIGLGLASPGSGERNSLRADLAVLDRSLHEYATARVTLAAALGGLPVALAFLTGLSGSVSWNPAVVLGAMVVGVIIGFVAARGALASEAAERRREFALELATYLDLVALLLSGGAGADEAMWRAARAADTPGLRQIHEAIRSARVRRMSVWRTLGELAERIRVPELMELVSAAQLAGDSGARVRSSLLAKSESLRSSASANDLANAERASERMGAPLVAMFLGFIILVIAPGIAQILRL